MNSVSLRKKTPSHLIYEYNKFINAQIENFHEIQKRL